MKTWRIVLIIVVAVVALVFLVLPRNHQPRHYRAADYPWGVHALSDGRSEVFGLTLGSSTTAPASTLADAMKRFDSAPELGLFESRAGKLSLEAYYGELTLGELSAKMVLTLSADAQTLNGMRTRAVDRKRVESGDNRYVLSSDDYRRAAALPIASITYIPYVDLNESIVERHFGTPAERVATAKGVEHLLYPKLGLDILLSDHGKDVLQYVAPRDFGRLRMPLLAPQPVGETTPPASGN